MRAVAWAGRVRLTGAAAVVTPVVTLALLGGISVWVPEVLGNGKEVVQLAFKGQVGLGLLLLLPALKAAATAGCLAGGARGGLFTPTMTIGAVTGGLLGYGWGRVWPGADLGLCAMVGSGAVLAAATQGPVSAVVLVLELTRHGDATMVPMLLAVGGATLTAGWLDGRSLYSARSGGVDVTANGPHAVSAADTLPAVVRQLLAQAGRGGTPFVTVIDDEGRPVGRLGPADVEPAAYRPIPLTAVTAGDAVRTPPPPAVPHTEEHP